MFTEILFSNVNQYLLLSTGSYYTFKSEIKPVDDSSGVTLGGAPDVAVSSLNNIVPPLNELTWGNFLVDDFFVYGGALSKKELEYLKKNNQKPLEPSPTGYALNVQGERHVEVGEPFNVESIRNRFTVTLAINPTSSITSATSIFSVEDTLKMSLQHVSNATRVRVQITNGNGKYDFDWTSSIPALPTKEEMIK